MSRWRGRKPLGAALLAAAGGVGAWLLLASPVLALHRVEVTGATEVGHSEVLARAGVERGVPLARVDTTAVAARIRAIPHVADVEVLRRWPTTLGILVEERVPVAVTPRGDGFGVLDAAGVEFDRVAEEVEGLPVITVGSRAPEESLRAAVDVLTGLPGKLRATVTALSAGSPDDVRLELDTDQEVVWGSADRHRRKAVVLRALLGQEADVYDVSAPDYPTTR